MLLAMTIGTAITVRGVMGSQSQAKFKAFTGQAAAAINAEVNRSLTELAAVEAYARVEHGLNAGLFSSFAETVTRRGGAVQALGYVPRISPAEVAEFNVFLANSGRDDYRLAGGSQQPEYFPLAYIAPPQPGFLSPGRDLLSDPVYGPLLNQGRKDLKLAVSVPARVSGDLTGQAVFLVFSPVTGQPDVDLAGDPGMGLTGFALGVYRVGDFLSGPANRSGLAGVKYRVLDREADATEVFPELGGDSSKGWDGFTVSETLVVAGRKWEMQTLAPPMYGLSPVERQVWKIVLAAGLALTLFATGSTYSLLKSRQAAHTDLQLMTNQLRVILDSALEGILLVDRNGRIVWANYAFADAFGHPGAQVLLGAAWRDVYRAARVELADPAAFIARMDEISLSEVSEVGSQDVQIKRPLDRTLSMTSAPVTDEKGAFLGRLWVFRDVTQERRAVQSQSVFVSMVSHELRTPLTSMTGFIELALDGAGGPLAEGAARLLRIAKSNGDRLVRLVSDILEVTRLETGHLTLELADISVGEVVEHLVESMHAEFEKRRQTLSVEIPDGLPAARADRQRTAQIISNLMTNSNRYTPDGGQVTISARSEAGKIEVTVRDTGLGIPMQYHERIFEKFGRIETKAPQPAGSTGLGLAITKALVELQGGWIKVESEVGKGSAFTFTLPLAGPSPGEAASASEEWPATTVAA